MHEVYKYGGLRTRNRANMNIYPMAIVNEVKETLRYYDNENRSRVICETNNT
jgi:hypothetical protein